MRTFLFIVAGALLAISALVAQEATPAPAASAAGLTALDVKPDIEKGPNDASHKSPDISLSALEGGGIKAECFMPHDGAQSFGFTKSLEPPLNVGIIRFEASNDSGFEVSGSLQFYDNRMKYYLIPFDLPVGGLQLVEINLADAISQSETMTADPPQQPIKKLGVSLRGEFTEGTAPFSFRNFTVEKAP